jgi:chromosome segregation protein
MYLSKLEIHGFKSFAQKISLRFSDGITAIVGPNGSGKTNIVDALRWVLGEQKSSVLRSDGMEQVIFNGTRTRKPLGMSEVSLTIENNKQILPTEYSQVVISRRLFRDGESNYLLNRTPCRLRDIVDLFTDTGMGADAYSVIELKMIEQILSDRSEERRHLFEEAAGIVKYKQRRKETLRKLASTQNDLERVQDIIREVQKAVGSLSRQAEKAQSYTEVSSALKREEELLFRYEYTDAHQRLQDVEALLNAANGERDTVNEKFNLCTSEVTELEASNALVETELRRVLEHERSESTILASAEQALAVLRERRTALERDSTRIRQEKISLHDQMERLSSDLAATRLKTGELQSDKLATEQSVSEKRESRNAQAQVVNEARDRARMAAEPIHSLESRLQFLASGRDRVRGQVQTSTEQSRQIAEQMQALDHQREQYRERMETAQTQLQESRQKVQEKEEQLNSARHRIEELAHSIDESQMALSSLRENFSHRQASLEFLQGLTEASESSTFLIDAPEWNVREKKLLSDCIISEDYLGIAVESCLGNAVGYFVVDTTEDAASARATLRAKEKGKASFVCRNAVPAAAAPTGLPQNDGVLGWASELVACDDTIRHVIRHLLGRTVVVRDLETAFAVVSSVDCAVTLDGEICYASGIVRTGSVGKAEGVRIGKQARIAQLQDELVTVRTKIDEVEQRLQQLKSERSHINVHALSDELRVREAAKASLEQSINELSVRLEALQTRSDQLHARLQDLTNENAVFVREDENIVRELEELRAKKLEAQSEYEVVLGQVTEAERNLAECEAELRNAELAAVRISTEIAAGESSMERMTQQQAALSARYESIDTDIASTDVALETCVRECTDQESVCRELDEKFRMARAERVTVEKQTHLSREALHAKNDELSHLRAALDAITSRIHELDITASQNKTRLEEYERRVAEDPEGAVDLTTQIPLEAASIEEIRGRVHSLRQKLGSMGAVNFLALEEHGREAERLMQLKSQYDDLLEAEKNLNDTIKEINTTAKRLFQEVFDQVRTHFKELFSILFNNDGEADLQLSGEDVLEAQIDIIAKPKGKRPHSIEMLSGGEKTLTAIALLFAIYLVKPSPFCILDEVDAPLDDANIDRYLNLIRNFSKNTQFLMITHNKRTMEAADTLYGVTMEEAGVSKIVSVKLRDGKEQRVPLEEADDVNETAQAA